MISKNLLPSICLVIFSFTPSHSWAQMNATIIWDEIKHIASENGFRISALISQSEEGIYITDFALIKKATDTNEVANVEIDLLDIQLLERDYGSVEIRPDYDQEIKIKVYEGREVLSFVLKPLRQHKYDHKWRSGRSTFSNKFRTLRYAIKRIRLTIKIPRK